MAQPACCCRPGIGVLCLLLLVMGQLPSRLADPDACAVDVGARSDCGYVGSQQEECEFNGCCWRPVPSSGASAATRNDAPWCFHPAAPDTTNYFVTDTSTQGATTTLQLNLSGSQLQQYGPDFQQLTMMVEQQTPQRLHTKILPAGTSRWEIPEDLVPRPAAEDFDPSQALYSVHLPAVGEPFSFSVIRQPPALAPSISRAGGLPIVPVAEGQVQSTQAVAADVTHQVEAGPMAAGWFPHLARKLMAVLSTHQQQPLHALAHAAWQRLVRLSRRDPVVPGLRSMPSSLRQQGTTTTSRPGTHQQATGPAKDADPEQLLFSSNHLAFKEQYLQLSTSLLEGAALYGLGETVQRGGLQLKRDGRVVTLWATDIGSNTPDTGLYGAHPFYLQVQPSGVSHGVLLLNSNGMDVTLEPQQLTYRVVGGVLDLYFFLGPTPEEVIRQYQQVIGRPAMPPWWALGFHQCRWGYHDLEKVAGVVEGYQGAGIPLDTIWTDIDYMNQYRDFTFDPVNFDPQRFRAFVDRLHSQELHWVPIIDCGIPQDPSDPAYVEGLDADVFIKDRTGQPYLGVVWPGATHWPDFLASSNVTRWWTTQLSRMYDSVPFDGIWIDMNEASNFCTAAVCRQAQIKTATTGMPGQLPDTGAPGVSTAAAQGATSASEMNDDCPLQCEQPPPDDLLARPPYAINKLNSKAALGHRTIDMRATHQDGTLEYDAHNLYGLSEAKVTAAAVEEVTGRRSFVLSRSTFPGSGRYAGHWTGDNAATWDDLRWSIPGVLNSNLWGIPLAGADICGFQGDTNEELCARWISAGAFYPFSRDHTAINTLSQELYRWPAVADAARTALGLRYTLLPYLYTAHYLAANRGGTVARPLLWVDPADATCRDVWLQWLLGEGLLISPVLQQGATSVSAYFPAGTWYSIWDNSSVTGPRTAELDAPLGVVPVHVRGGTIVPRQQAAATSAAVRRSEVDLLVALGAPAAAGQQRPYAGFDQCTQLGQAALQLLRAPQQQPEELHRSPQQGFWWQFLTQLRQISPLAPFGSSSGGAQHEDMYTRHHHHQQRQAAGQEEEGLFACGALYLDDGVSLQLGGENTLEAWFAAAASADGLAGGLVVQGEEAPVASAATAGGSSGARGVTEPLPGVSQVTLLGVGLGVPSMRGLAVPQESSTGASWAAAGGPRVASATVHVEVNGIALPDELVAYDPAKQTLQVVLPETQAWSWRLTWSVQLQQLHPTA